MRDGEVHTEGAVAVRLRGAQVLPCVSQGAGPVGPEMTITSAEANVIGQLAGKPAMERLGEVIASLPENERELAAVGGADRPRHRREPARVRARRLPGAADHRRRPRVGCDRDRRAGPSRADGAAACSRRRLSGRGPPRGAARPGSGARLGRRGRRPALHLQRPRLPHVRGAGPRRGGPRGLARRSRPPASSARGRSARSAAATSCTASPRRWRSSRHERGAGDHRGRAGPRTQIGCSAGYPSRADDAACHRWIATRALARSNHYALRAARGAQLGLQRPRDAAPSPQRTL